MSKLQKKIDTKLVKSINKKIKTAAITAYSGGELKKLVDIPIHVKIKDMEIAEDSQMAIFHYKDFVLIIFHLIQQKIFVHQDLYLPKIEFFL